VSLKLSRNGLLGRRELGPVVTRPPNFELQYRSSTLRAVVCCLVCLQLSSYPRIWQGRVGVEPKRGPLKRQSVNFSGRGLRAPFDWTRFLGSAAKQPQACRRSARNSQSSPTPSAAFILRRIVKDIKSDFVTDTSPLEESLETTLSRILFRRSVNRSLMAIPECSGAHILHFDWQGSGLPAEQLGRTAASRS
jgi:hypothetical protein